MRKSEFPIFHNNYLWAGMDLINVPKLKTDGYLSEN